MCFLARALACVASVSVRFPRKFRCFGRAKIGARAKKKQGGGGDHHFFALALFSRGRRILCDFCLTEYYPDSLFETFEIESCCSWQLKPTASKKGDSSLWI